MRNQGIIRLVKGWLSVEGRVGRFWVSLLAGSWFLLLLVSTTTPAYAAGPLATVCASAACDTSSGYMHLDCLELVYCYAYNSLFSVAGLVAFAFIIIGGFRYITAGGDDKEIEAAQKTLTYAVLGLFLVAISYIILRIISGHFFPSDPAALFQFKIKD